MSKKTKEDRQYSQLRKDFLSKNPLCRARLLDCSRIATEIHHKRGRGIYYLVVDTWLAVCRQCHNWIENHPKEAKQLGLSLTRLT